MKTRCTLVLVAGSVAFGALAGCSGDEPAATADSAAAISTVVTTAAAVPTTVAETAPPTTAASTTVAEVTTTVAPTTVPPTTVAPCRDVPTIPLGLEAVTPETLAVRLGDCGPGVTQIQEKLEYHGYGVDIDGRFGPATEAAVREFQRSFMRTTPDGIVGPRTWDALNSDDYDPSEA